MKGRNGNRFCRVPLECFVLSKHSLSEEISESRLLMDSGMFFRIEGGWLDFLCT